MKFGKYYWPHAEFYDKQRDIIYSIRDNDETYVVAGNQLGKDYVTGFIALSFFMAPQMYFPASYVRQIEAQRNPGNTFPHTRRVITTSIKDDHLRVLWGEIGRFVQGAREPLVNAKGCPLIVNYHEIRLAHERESKNPHNYLLGCVSEKGEGLSGHHAAYTLMIGDEASGIDDAAYEYSQGWAKKYLWIGNPNSTENFYRKGVEAGDLVAK